MQIRKTAGAIDGSLQCIRRRLYYWQFLLQSRLSHSIEQYNEPPRLQGTSQNRILWFKSTRRMPGGEVLGTPLKK